MHFLSRQSKMGQERKTHLSMSTTVSHLSVLLYCLNFVLTKKPRSWRGTSLMMMVQSVMSTMKVTPRKDAPQSASILVPPSTSRLSIVWNSGPSSPLMSPLTPLMTPGLGPSRTMEALGANFQGAHKQDPHNNSEQPISILFSTTSIFFISNYFHVIVFDRLAEAFCCRVIQSYIFP